MMRVLIMAGGTGGHVFPALAVAECLRDQGVEVTWMGTRQGLEADIVPRAGFDMEWISVTGLRGKGLLSWLLAPFRLCAALLQALLIMMRCRPMAVLGMGGFVAGPGGLIAWLLKRPLLIHEQNAVAGLTNRLLAHVADRVMEAFPQALPARSHPQLTGNPVRREIAALAAPGQRFAAREDGLRLLVLGGSLGAQALNEVMPPMLTLLPWAIQVRHQAGQRNLDAARAAYAARTPGLPVQHSINIEPFIDDMAAAYGWADVVVCRAGALTVSELAAAGVASILVPYPFAVDDHQSRNAAWLAEAGAAVLIPQTQLSPEGLAAQLQQLWPAEHGAGPEGPFNLETRQTLLHMAQQARAMAHLDATDQVAQACMEAGHDD